jgi:hypothetical protein
MKVWRGFTLTVWAITLTLLAAFLMQYHALQTTILDSGAAKTRLAQSGAYKKLRDTVLTERLRSVVQERYPENTLVDDAMLRSILAETLPDDEMQRRFEPAVEAFYRWTDSKEPEIDFTIDLSDKVGVFYRVLEVQLGKKLATLPSCGDYRYPPEEAILVDKCIPVYISVTEATAAAMDALKTSELPIGNTITPETFGFARSQSSAFKQLPTYLNYLWVLNYVAITLFVLVTFLLAVTRRSLGVLAVGVSLIAASVTVWFTQPIIRNLIPEQTDGIFAAVSEATRTLLAAFTTTGTRYALYSLLAGIVLAVSASGWRWWQRRRHA